MDETKKMEILVSLKTQVRIKSRYPNISQSQIPKWVTFTMNKYAFTHPAEQIGGQ